MHRPYQNWIALSTLIVLAGFVLSGPVALLIVQLLYPQPVWETAETFVAHYHPLQNLPFYFGFVLVVGLLMLVTGHFLVFRKRGTPRFKVTVALGLTIAFTALISFNYICQTTFIHNMATHYKSDFDVAIAMFSMANPLSLCWAIEMWGYAVLGLATWFLAECYRQSYKLLWLLLIVNGMVSILAAVFTAMDAHWVMSFTGLVAYTAWNLLMIWILIAMYLYWRKPIIT